MRSFGFLFAALSIALLQGAQAQYDAQYEEFNWQLVTDVFDETVFQLEALDSATRDTVLAQILSTAFEVLDYVEGFVSGGEGAAPAKGIAALANKKPGKKTSNKNKFNKGQKKE